MKGVSVVICCFNSQARLPETLSHILRQVFSTPFDWEVIVVDNASTDNTRQVAKAYSQSFQGVCNFEVVTEQRSGLSNARNKGIQHSKYSYILFCDDDNWLESHYIEQCFVMMESEPTIGACGGKGIGACEVDPPYWFKYFERPYAVGAPLRGSGKLIDATQFLTGAGMMLRRAAYDHVVSAGFVSLLSDRKGTSLSSGGDLELCYILRLAGYELYFIETATYKHFIPKERLTEEYLRKLHIGIGRSNVLLTVYEYFINQLPVSKPFTWLRLLILLTPKTLRLSVIRNNDIVHEMEKVMSIAYYKELARLRGRFDKELRKLNEVRRRLVA